MVLDCPYFEPRTSDGFDQKSEEQAGFFGLQDIESASAVQSSSTINQHNLQGIAVESFCQETTLPSSGKVMLLDWKLLLVLATVKVQGYYFIL